MDRRAERRGWATRRIIRPAHLLPQVPQSVWATRVQTEPDSLSSDKKQQRHISHTGEKNLERVPKVKRGFFPSNKLSNKPLIVAVAPPSRASEYVVQYRLNFKEKLLQLPLHFPDVNHLAAATWWFISGLQKEKNQTHIFKRSDTLYPSSAGIDRTSHSEGFWENTKWRLSVHCAVPSFSQIHKVQMYCVWWQRWTGEHDLTHYAGSVKE